MRVDDVASTIHQSLQETRVQMRVDDVTSTTHQALASTLSPKP
jgi:hypothetical protein